MTNQFSAVARLTRFARGYARAFLFRRNTLKVVEILPTFACNLKCSMCAVSKFKRSREYILELHDYARIAEEAAKLGATTLTVLGGEPLLFQPLSSVLEVFARRHFYIYLVSNGRAVTLPLLEALHEAGLKCIFFSVESMDETFNDSIRGAGHLSSSMRAIDLAQKVGIRVGLATVVFPGQIGHARAVFEYAAKRGLAASGGQLVPVGSASGQPMLGERQVLEVREVLREHRHLRYDWMSSYFGRERCPAGKEELSITCYGDVLGCSCNPISFGSVLEEPLGTIWLRMQKFSQFRRDYPGCLCSEDHGYFDRYLRPISDAQLHPVRFDLHPAIDSTTEPSLFPQK